MGYEVYYPRFKIPGARPSPDYEVPLLDAGTAQRVETPPSAKPGKQAPEAIKPQAEARPARVESIQPNTPSTAVEKSAESASVPTKPDSAAADDELRFSLQYFAINENLAIINEAPHQLRGKQNRESQLLLQAILAAILPAQEGLELAPVEFDWPIAEGLAAADPRRAASLALHGFINQRQEQDGFANLLVFAAQIHTLLLGERDGEVFGDQESADMTSKLTVTHSLQSMLVHPLLKRETWAHLQSLRSRLLA